MVRYFRSMISRYETEAQISLIRNYCPELSNLLAQGCSAVPPSGAPLLERMEY